jgi:hypothetical protein
MTLKLHLEFPIIRVINYLLGKLKLHRKEI